MDTLTQLMLSRALGPQANISGTMNPAMSGPMGAKVTGGGGFSTPSPNFGGLAGGGLSSIGQMLGSAGAPSLQGGMLPPRGLTSGGRMASGGGLGTPIVPANPNGNAAPAPPQSMDGSQQSQSQQDRLSQNKYY